MKSERWQQIEQLYNSAPLLLPRQKRFQIRPDRLIERRLRGIPRTVSDRRRRTAIVRQRAIHGDRQCTYNAAGGSLEFKLLVS